MCVALKSFPVICISVFGNLNCRLYSVFHFSKQYAHARLKCYCKSWIRWLLSSALTRERIFYLQLVAKKKKKKSSFLYFSLACWFSLGLQAVVGYPSTFCFQQVGGQICLGTPAGQWEFGEAGAGQGGEPFPGAGEQGRAVLGQEYPCSHPCSNGW